MSKNIVLHDYNGHPVAQRPDGYVSLTAMAKAEGKRINDYFRLDSTKEYLKALSSDAGIPVTELYQVLQGAHHEIQGTWAHPEVAIDFAQWVSVPFRIWANRTLRSHIEAQPQPTVNIPIAPALDTEQRISILKDAFDFFQLDKSPRHLQLVQDRIANLLDAKALAASTEPRWQGVAEIAEALGYKAVEVAKVRSPLGRAVAAWYRGEVGAEPSNEKRIVNGRSTELKVYQRNEDLDGFVLAWLNQKGLSNLAIAA